MSRLSVVLETFKKNKILYHCKSGKILGKQKSINLTSVITT